MLVTPACLARPVPEEKAQEGWTGLQAWAAGPLVSTGYGGAGTRSSCGSHKPTWWQSGRLQHAGLGKSAPATKAQGWRQGCWPESGSRSCSGLGVGGGVEHPVLFEGFNSPNSTLSFIFQRIEHLPGAGRGRSFRPAWHRGHPQRRQHLFRTSKTTVTPQKKFLPPHSLPAPSAGPAARPAGRLLLDAPRSSQPSETRRGPSGPSGPLHPHPA